jgi:hypothetical protein
MRIIVNRIIYTLTIGAIIAGIIDFISDFIWLNQYLLYIQSMLISCFISLIMENVYKKIIIRKKYSPLFKRALVYLTTLLLYAFINLIFLGPKILLQYQFYLVAIIIILMMTPLFNRLTYSMRAYETFLKAKQK